MNNRTFDRTLLGLAATLMLVGQLLYVVVTLFHTVGPANNHPAVFAAADRQTILRSPTTPGRPRTAA